jgi:tetratricopeptide (TPR) repeat protein
MQPRVDSTGGKTAAAVQPGKAPTQLEVFEQAMRLFHTRKFSDARALFQKASNGPERHIAHKAELHVRMCDRRLEREPLVLNSPEEHYNYAITQMNARNLNGALHHLEIALAGDADADHVHYALALCHGLQGNGEVAYQHLKRAIELQPRNRITARQDADFAPMVNLPPFDELLYPEKKQ